MQRGQTHERLGYLKLPVSPDLDMTSTHKIPAILQLSGPTFPQFKKGGGLWAGRGGKKG